MSTPCSPSPPLHLDSTLGAAYIGESCSTLVTCLSITMGAGNIVVAMFVGPPTSGRTTERTLVQLVWRDELASLHLLRAKQGCTTSQVLGGYISDVITHHTDSQGSRSFSYGNSHFSVAAAYLHHIIRMLDGLHLALISHTMYFYTVTNFNNPPQIARVTW